MTLQEINDLEAKIEFATEQLDIIITYLPDPKYQKEFIRLSDWLDRSIKELDRLRASRKITEFFGEDVEISPDVIIRQKFKTETWKDGSTWDVVRDERGRFIKRVKT